MSRHAFIELDDHTGKLVRRLWRIKPFAEAHTNLVGSHDALRKQVERRHTNGLIESGAVVETRMGILLDPVAYRTWLLTPPAKSEAA